MTSIRPITSTSVWRCAVSALVVLTLALNAAATTDEPPSAVANGPVTIDTEKVADTPHEAVPPADGTSRASDTRTPLDGSLDTAATTKRVTRRSRDVDAPGRPIRRAARNAADRRDVRGHPRQRRQCQ